jgi:predicted amidohydrolase YtcJ
VVDLGGATVMPGIVDPHIHMMQHESPDTEAMAAAQQTVVESGRTTVGIPGADPAIYDAFKEFDQRAVLRIRLYVLYNTNCGEPPVDPDFWRSVAFDDEGGARIVIAGVKVFADGGSCHGPAVSWEYPETFPAEIPFDDWVGNGSLFVTAEELAAVVAETDDRGGQVVVHAAGERAVVTALDGMELALGDGGNPRRHRMDHNDFVPPDQRPRYGELGVVPVVFGDYDSCFEPAGMWSLLAPTEVLSWHRANRTLIETNPGLPVAWHSDLPYTRTDVFAQMQFLVNVAEVTEEGVYCDAPEFLADEGTGIEQAIRMMTWKAAYAMNMEDSVGSLEPGKWADLIIIQKDPQALPDDRVFDNTLWATMIGGVTHYCHAGTAVCDALTR